MTMTVPPTTKEVNVVVLQYFSIDSANKSIAILFKYGYKAPSDELTEFQIGAFSLGETKYTQLLNATPTPGKTFKQWIRPLIYAEIADYLNVPVGDID